MLDFTSSVFAFFSFFDEQPNNARACVKTPSAKCVKDPFFVLRHFEWPRLLGWWSKNEFLRKLANGLAFTARFVAVIAKVSNRLPALG
jgi:hypothetical protein